MSDTPTVKSSSETPESTAFHIIPPLSAFTTPISNFYGHNVKPYIDQGFNWYDKQLNSPEDNVIKTINSAFLAAGQHLETLKQKAAENPQLITYGTGLLSGLSTVDGIRRVVKNKGNSVLGFTEMFIGAAGSYYLYNNQNEHTLGAVSLFALTGFLSTALLASQSNEKPRRSYDTYMLPYYPKRCR